MRLLALSFLALAFAGCGGHDATTVGGEGGACAAAVVYHHALYVMADKHRPALKGRLAGGYAPACNDHEGGDPGPDQPVVLRRIGGVAASEAVYSRVPFPGVYRRSGGQP
jgi:hypothetical protein